MKGLLKRIKDKLFQKKTQKTILRFLILVAIIAAIAVGTYFILRACGLTTNEDFQRLREELSGSPWLYIVVILLQVIQVVFVPISNQIVTAPLSFVFSDNLLFVFLSCWIGIEIGTMILYFIGRFAGEKVLSWVLSDKQQTEKCKNFISRGKWFYPAGMCLGFIPDDILTTLAGLSKYNFWYVLFVSAITRAFCCFCTVFAFGYLVRHWWGWIVLAFGFLFVLGLSIILFKLNKKSENKKVEDTSEEITENLTEEHTETK